MESSAAAEWRRGKNTPTHPSFPGTGSFHSNCRQVMRVEALTSPHRPSTSIADGEPLLFEASKLVIDGTQRVRHVLFTFIVRCLRILARKLCVLIRQISNQNIQFGCGKSHVNTYTTSCRPMVREETVCRTYRLAIKLGLVRLGPHEPIWLD
jgi:hypothetical protein